jgi:hypothetical protein
MCRRVLPPFLIVVINSWGGQAWFPNGVDRIRGGKTGIIPGDPREITRTTRKSIESFIPPLAGHPRQEANFKGSVTP